MTNAMPDSADVHKLPAPKNAPRVPHQFGGEVRVALVTVVALVCEPKVSS